MLSVTVFFTDANGNHDSSDYICDAVITNGIGDLSIHFSDGLLRLNHGSFESFCIYPYLEGESKATKPLMPLLADN